ncbi:hypothetical protein QQZ08_012406 [Neonectria magnoliae]|uniref:Uncharacterized protein n=1 Tax=Neonectria magnoliae TaxID=2732573 RepID=A0ABR1H2X1_9HYPO
MPSSKPEPVQEKRVQDYSQTEPSVSSDSRGLDVDLLKSAIHKPTSTLEEPCFIPASTTTSPEGSGYLVAVIDRLDEMRQDLAIFNAQELSAGRIGLVRLPLRPRRGFHGNFVNHADIKAFAKRQGKGGDLGPAKAVEKPLLWQLDV